MSYEKQNFLDGQILKGDHLNKMEEGIAANADALENKQPKGNYATEKFVTEKISEAQLGGGQNADAVRYVEQNLTEEQQAQARGNIGAAPMSLFDIPEGEVTTELTSIMPAEKDFAIGKYCNPEHGGIADVATYRCTEDYIAFPDGAKLMVHYSANATKNYYPIISYYDANKIHVGGEYGNRLTQEDYDGKLCAFYTVPKNTRFIRISIPDNIFSLDYFQYLHLYTLTDVIIGAVKIPDLIVPLSAL